MTNERRRAIIVVVATLLVGILIGALGQAMLAKNYHRMGRDSRKFGHDRKDNPGRKHFVDKVYRITRATDTQKAAMEPILNQSMDRFDSLRGGFGSAARANLDALFVALTEVLEPGQVQDLKDHFAKGDLNRGRK